MVLEESSPDYVAKRFPFIDLDKGDFNQGADSSALGILVRNAGVAHTVLPPTDAKGLTDLGLDDPAALGVPEDRKSTRLNSSHQIISYAVFCLKKKKLSRI